MDFRPQPPKRKRTRYDVAQPMQPSALSVVSSRVPGWVRAVLIGVVLVVGLGTLFGMWFMGPAWRVNEINVRNNTGVPIDRVIAASALQGEHTQWADLTAAAERIDELPGIEGAKIVCTWNGVCEVGIQETSAVALWQSGAGQVWVDGERKVQLLADNANIVAPFVVRVESGGLPSTEKLLDERTMRTMAELQAANPSVKQYAYSDEFGFMFNTNEGVRVRLGFSEYSGAMQDKLSVMQKLDTLLRAQQTKVSVLDVRFVEAPYYVK